MFRIFACCIFMLLTGVLFAQSTVPLPQIGLKAAYLGSLIYPGFKLGIERPYKIIVVEKQKRRGTKTVLKERHWTLNLGYYHHANFHDNLYLLAEWQLRRQKPKGWFWEFAPGAGYSRTFLGGATYQVADNGAVSKKRWAGYHYAMFSLAGGLGYDFSNTRGRPIKAYFKPSLLVLMPYNSFIYLRPTIELGIIHTPSRFFKTKPTIKIKKK